jgi:GNAT superfamily N-acetyltransferase
MVTSAVRHGLSGVVVREALPSDVDAIVRTHVESSEEAYAPLANAWPAVDLERRRALWAGWVDEAQRGDGGRVELVGEVEGRVVGFISGGPARQRERGAELEVYVIHVLPSQRGTGLGSLLWSAACQRLRGPGLRSLYVSTLAELRCCSFYERHGGQVLSRRPHLFHGAERTEVIYLWPAGHPSQLAPAAVT